MTYNSEKANTFQKIIDIVLSTPGLLIGELYGEIQITFGLSEKQTANYVNILLRRRLLPRLQVNPDTRVVTVCL